MDTHPASPTSQAPGVPIWRSPSFLGGVWHGAFLAASTALSDIVVILPAFIHDLTGSSVWVGGLAALVAVAGALPQILVARYVEPLQHKRPVLLLAIYLRTASLAGLGVLIATADASRPARILAALVVMMALFAAGGALGNVPYTDLVGRVIPAGRRGLFFASRQMSGSVLALGASGLAALVLRGPLPMAYAHLFLLAALVLTVASVGIWMIREPPLTHTLPPRQPWSTYLRSLREPARRLWSMAGALWATGFGLLAIPFYVVAGRETLGAPAEAMGLFIGANVVGALVGNLAWGRLVDRYGSRRMLLVCVGFAVITPLLALLASVLGWQVLIGVFVLVGATSGGRRVGFQSALLEEAPAARRSSYVAVYALMGLPVALMPLLGGWLARQFSFTVLFGLTAALLAGAVVVVRAWAGR